MSDRSSILATKGGGEHLSLMSMCPRRLFLAGCAWCFWFSSVCGWWRGGPIGSGELYMHVIAVSFHALCMPHLQHVEGSEARSYPGLEAHASLFGVQHPVPVDTRVSSHTIYILWVQQFSRSLLLFIYFNFYFNHAMNEPWAQRFKRHRLPIPHFSGWINSIHIL